MNFVAQDLFIPILQILVISVRVGSLWIFFPVLGQAQLPTTVRLAGALTLSIALRPLAAPYLPQWTLAQMPELHEFVYVIAREFVIGAGMGLVSKWMFTTAFASAQWIGGQMGFSQGGIINPEFDSSESAWAEFNQWIALMVFLSIGGHWLFIQAIADSYALDLSNIFTQLTNIKAAEFWIEIGRRFFFWMLKLAGPLMVVLLLLQGALGVLSRFIPQINMWIVSIPLTLGVGVFVFSLLSPMYGDALQTLFAATHESNYMWLKFIGGR